jgi:dUTP pyrophosphatase
MMQQEFMINVYNESNNPLPAYAKEGDSGMDIRASEDFCVYPNEIKMIDTGISVGIPYAGLEIQVRPRSGMSAKTKLRIANSPGTVDQGYTGKIKIIFDNIGDEPVKFSAGERIAQLVLCPVYKIVWNPVKWKEDLGKTERGDSGFGSSGIK